MHRPPVVFLDEPTAGVDLRSRALFWELIQEESAAGTTIFVTTHFMEEADYCDRVCFIHAGRLIADDTPDGLRRRWAGGYRILVDGVSAERAAAALERPVEPSPTGVALTVEVPADDLLARLAALAAADERVHVRVEQPAMTDVFRRVLRASAEQK